MAPPAAVPQSRGSCVSVSRVITYFTFERTCVCADDEREALAGIASQKRVQIPEFAALALVAHPYALHGIPAAWSMKEKERYRCFACRGYFSFSCSILSLRMLQQAAFVPGQRFLVGIRKIGQQSEVQVVVAIRQEPDFQRLDQLVDVRVRW